MNDSNRLYKVTGKAADLAGSAKVKKVYDLYISVKIRDAPTFVFVASRQQVQLSWSLHSVGVCSSVGVQMGTL